jgi:hypothetical protein
MFGNEETVANATLRKYLSDYVDNSNVFNTDTETGFKLDTSNKQEVIDFYESLQKARDEMLDTMTTEQIAASGTYKAVNELLTNTSDAYETAVEEMDAYAETAGNALTNALGDGSDIKTMEEFLAYKNEFLELGTSDEYGLTED